MPVLSSQDEVGQNRDVVIGADPFFADRAEGWREDNVDLPGKAVDDHIQKTAPYQAE